MQRLINMMAEHRGPDNVDFDFVLVAGHFLARDENIFTFFEGRAVVPPQSHSKYDASIGAKATVTCGAALEDIATTRAACDVHHLPFSTYCHIVKAQDALGQKYAVVLVS